MDRPLLFVAMPFGTKKDPKSRRLINFDDVYELAIAPAADAAGVEVIRADQELTGGFIHAPMYERLLLSEIVVADLTMANPNVLYELGIRHAARPKSTILIFLEGTALPFDVRPLRAIPYRLENYQMTSATAAVLKEALVTRLKQACKADEAADSPLFQLLQKYPGIQVNMADAPSFRHRVQMISQTKERIAEAVRRSDVAALAGIEQSAVVAGSLSEELFISLLSAYRDLSAWSEVVRAAESAPTQLREGLRVLELFGMALNRRNDVGDRDRAIEVLRHAIAVYGENPETCGLLGRVYKDQYRQALKGGAALTSQGALDEAIRYYRKGFEADPRDHYPGINLATLLLAKGRAAALDELNDILPMVAFAVRRLGGVEAEDYWTVATYLELAYLRQDWASATAAAGRLVVMKPAGWQMQTTFDNLELIVAGLERTAADTAQARALVAELGALA